MKLNTRNILLGDKADDKGPVLLAVTPPRAGERTLLGVENLLQSIAVPEPFSLELAGDMDGVTLMARCLDDRVVRGQLSAHYPQARIQTVDPQDDPLRVEEKEQAWSMTLRADGPEYIPLRTFRDDDLLDPGSDPLIALMGALSNLNEGERVVARLMLRSLGPDWSQHHLDKAHKLPGYEPREPAYTFQTKPLQLDGVTMAVLGIGAFAALKGYLWVQDGEIWKAALLGLGASLGMVVGGWAWWRWKKARNRVEDPVLIREKVSRIAFDAELQVTAIVPSRTGPQRAGELLGPVAAAYRHYDNPAGARFKIGRVRPAAPDPKNLHPQGPGLFGRRSVLGVREIASLWHPPGAGDETPLVERSGARALNPSAKGTRGGALVGDTTAGARREIRFPEDLLRRHHLYVARTRMGKSTLMHHVVTHKLKEKAADRDGDAIVVIDPHTDLVAGILEHVPDSLADRVRLIDLSDETRAPGINLLDTRIFSDRDRTADSVVRVAKGLWDQWGPRMQSILEQTVKTLHEANEQMEVEQQYTILDGLKLLSNDPFRNGVLKKVSDPYLLEWWANTFTGWSRDYKADSLAPVQTRLSYYASSKRARAILGQRRSTIDMRRTIHDGGILLVSTSQGTVGRDVAALVGASLLNLVDAVIREQGSLRLEQRRGALVVVDEMQSMPGVDYESMLSELGKFGASFILATQSLAKLDDLSRTMRDTLLANVGCLAVFQVAGNDARTLVWELGKERVTEDDITSLPVHHCYVRATVGMERMPAFSMMVRKPEEGNPETADRIREATTAYTVSDREGDYADADGHKKVGDFRKGLEDLEQGGTGEPQAEEDADRRTQKSKRDRLASDDDEDRTDEDGGEEAEL
ncbi:MAG: type IV secretion system DNA-binding domain-containing protein [Dehalococcoidia bacterium]|nr:type IV secretion system DNA-binding domain-containing protein [Dehalococcoidia bacterium]